MYNNRRKDCGGGGSRVLRWSLVPCSCVYIYVKPYTYIGWSQRHSTRIWRYLRVGNSEIKIDAQSRMHTARVQIRDGAVAVVDVYAVARTAFPPGYASGRCWFMHFTSARWQKRKNQKIGVYPILSLSYFAGWNECWRVRPSEALVRGVAETLNHGCPSFVCVRRDVRTKIVVNESGGVDTIFFPRGGAGKTKYVYDYKFD